MYLTFYSAKYCGTVDDDDGTTRDIVVVGDAMVEIFSAQNENWRIGGCIISFVQS